MVRRLTLRNFKSHRDSTLLLANVTSIIGENDAGKSNLFRGFRLVCHHDDWPDRWIRWGQDKGEIEVETKEGLILRRIRTPKTEKTEIVRGGVTTSYKGKVDATKFVQDALGIRKLLLDDPKKLADLNFIPVFSTPFLILDPPQQAQRKVAAIVGGTEIDEARRDLASEVKDLTAKRKLLVEQLDLADEEVTKAELYVASLGTVLEDLQILNAKAVESRSRAKEITGLLARRNAFQSALLQPKTVQQLRKGLGDARQFLDEMRVAVERRAQVYHLQSLFPAKRYSPNNLAKLKGLLRKAKTDLADSQRYYKRLTDLNALAVDCSHCDAMKVEQVVCYTIAQEARSQALVGKAEILNQMRVCPTCGNKIESA